MSSLLMFVPPVAAGVLATAAMVAAEDAGLPVGAPEATMGLVVLMLVRELIKDRRERKEDAAEKIAEDPRLEVQKEIAGHLATAARLLTSIDIDQRQILQITKQYQATGVCPWTEPMKRHDTIRDVGEAVAQRVPSASAIAEEVRDRFRDDDR